MRLYFPVGGGAYAGTGCVLTPVVGLVYLVALGAMLAFGVAAALLAGTVFVIAWTGYGLYRAGWAVRLAHARRKARQDHSPPENPARWSNRR